MRRGTYSIVARDPADGSLGVAVQSHWFGVGRVVPWARPGVGAVATQAIAEISYGPRALDLLAVGAGAADALDPLLRADEKAAHRQVAVVDAGGRHAVHTGERCIAHAGHLTGAGFSCQANMMLGETVPVAMAEAFTGADGALAARLLAALDAAQAEGGDVRGRQSAALLVVPPAGERWERTIDIRVDDHPDPLVELRRLLRLAEAYTLADRADDSAAAGDIEAAARFGRAALELAPESDELLFWSGLERAAGGDVAGGAEMVQAAIARNPGWAELLPRLGPDMAPAGEAVSGFLGLTR